jgi:hypothetical protein
MGAFTYIETDTGTNVDISAATAVGAYTSTGDKLIMVDVSIDAVAGNGDYVMYVTRQIGGSGSAYRILPQTTMAAASGLTAISAQSGWITVRNGDVLTCYVVGLAGDTSTPDWYTRWFELAAVAAPDNTGIAAIQAKTDQLTFTTPNKVDATATVDTTGIATSAALAVVDANVDAIKAKTDALDVSSVTVVSSVEGSTLTVLRGDTWDDAHLLNLCDLTDYVSIDFLVKESKADTDDDAIIHIRKNVSGVSDGLLRLNKAAHTTGTDGAITIEDIPTGDITPTLKAAVTKDLAQGNYVYDVQVITATSVKTRTSGKLVVTADVTRLVA